MTDLLIQNGTVLPMDGGEEILPGGAVAVRDGRIAAVGKPADLKRMGFGEGKTLNARGQVVMPGLVNAHAHLRGNLLKALPEDLATRKGMQKAMHLLFDEADGKEMEALARASFLEALKSGVTCLGLLESQAGDLSGVAEESGIRAVLAEALSESDPAAVVSGSPKLDAQAGKSALEAALGRIGDGGQVGGGAGRVTARLGVLGPSLCSEEMLEALAKESDARKLGLHFHLAVSPAEAENLRSGPSGEILGLLRRLGLLRSNTLLAGGEYLKEEEVAGLRESAAQLVLAPRAEAMRGSRAPAAALLRGKIPLALGTDGVGNDLFSEVRALLLSACAEAGSGGIVGPGEVLRMATRDGARALGLLGSVGSIEIGKKADLILVTLDPARSALLETEDAAALVANVCGPGDVTDVVVDGEVVMEGGKVKSLDEKAVLKEAQKAAVSVWKRVAG